MKKIVKTTHGSRLYGLHTENSDHDYKGVYLPSLRDVLIHGPNNHTTASTNPGASKNSASDVDESMYSMVKFFELLKKGEMIAMDMIFTPNSHVLEGTMEWSIILESRDIFLTKDMRSYTGYIRKQVAKYSAKGSRLDALKSAIDFFETCDQQERIGSYFDLVPTDTEYLLLSSSEGPNQKLQFFYQVLGKMFSETTRVETVLKPLKKIYAEYGHRAILAQQNEGVDWKAVSHAFRALIQLEDLYLNGTMTLPLRKEHIDFLMPIKLGQRSWNELSDVLDEKTEQVNALSASSKLPDKIDKEKVEDLIIHVSEIGYKIRL